MWQSCLKPACKRWCLCKDPECPATETKTSFRRTNGTNLEEWAQHVLPVLGAVLLATGFFLYLFHVTVWARRVVLGHIEALIDAAGNGLDVCHQLVFDGLQVEAIFWRDQVYGQAQVTKPPWEREQFNAIIPRHIMYSTFSQTCVRCCILGNTQSFFKLKPATSGAGQKRLRVQGNEVRAEQHTWSSNAMEVGLRVLGKVEVDDDVDSLNVNTSGEQIYKNVTKTRST